MNNIEQLEARVRAALASATRPGNESIMLQNERGHWRPASELLREVKTAIEAMAAFKQGVTGVMSLIDDLAVRGQLYHVLNKFETDTNPPLNNLKKGK